METRTFKCNHSAEVPRNMGKGSLREKRINEYFNRSCCNCRCAAEIKLQNSLTRIDGSPRPAEFVTARIELKLKQIRLSY